MSQAANQNAIRKDNPTLQLIGKIALYIVLIAVALFTLIPFVWMISSSLSRTRKKSRSTITILVSGIISMHWFCK